MHPSARDPARRTVRRDSGGAGLWDFIFLLLFFFLTKSLSGTPPPSPRPAPPSLHAHAAPPRHTRCVVLLPPDNGLWAGQAARPEPPAPSRDPERAERGGWRGAEKSKAGEATMGKVGASPLGQEARSRRREKKRGRGSAAPPRPEPRHALTSTMANRSSSSPGSGIGSFKGTLCALKSVCCESMLPALPMLAARRGRGLLRAPRVRFGNQNSSRRPAPAPWRDPPGSPLSAAPRRVCSAHRSLAALRAEPPPGLPHALHRPSAAPASLPREGSSGRRAPICMLLLWHAAPCLRSRPAGACVLGLGLAPGRGRR